MCEVSEALAFIDKILKADDEDMSDTLKKMNLENADETVSQMNDLEDKVSDMLDTEKQLFLDKINSGESLEEALQAVKDSFDSDEFASTATTEFKSFYTDFIKELTTAYMVAIDPEVAFDTLSDYTTEFIKEWSTQLGEHLQLTSHEKVEKILTKGIEDGKGIEDIALELADNYSWSRARARRVSITEVLTAHSYSQHEAYMQSPAVEKIKWKHSGTKKNNARESHIALNGVSVDKGELFTIDSESGSYTCKFPRDTNLPPSERVHCHCTTGPVVDSSILGMTQEEKHALRDKALEDWNNSFNSDKST